MEKIEVAEIIFLSLASATRAASAGTLYECRWKDGERFADVIGPVSSIEKWIEQVISMLESRNDGKSYYHIPSWNADDYIGDDANYSDRKVAEEVESAIKEFSDHGQEIIVIDHEVGEVDIIDPLQFSDDTLNVALVEVAA